MHPGQLHSTRYYQESITQLAAYWLLSVVIYISIRVLVTKQLSFKLETIYSYKNDCVYLMFMITKATF